MKIKIRFPRVRLLMIRSGWRFVVQGLGVFSRGEFQIHMRDAVPHPGNFAAPL